MCWYWRRRSTDGYLYGYLWSKVFQQEYVWIFNMACPRRSLPAALLTANQAVHRSELPNMTTTLNCANTPEKKRVAAMGHGSLRRPRLERLWVYGERGGPEPTKASGVGRGPRVLARVSGPCAVPDGSAESRGLSCPDKACRADLIEPQDKRQTIDRGWKIPAQPRL